MLVIVIKFVSFSHLCAEDAALKRDQFFSMQRFSMQKKGIFLNIDKANYNL